MKIKIKDDEIIEVITCEEANHMVGNLDCEVCNSVFEDKFVQYPSNQDIKIYIKRNGVAKLIYKDIVTTTKFWNCPSCGRRLISEIKCRKCNKDYIPSSGARELAELCDECMKKMTKKYVL